EAVSLDKMEHDDKDSWTFLTASGEQQTVDLDSSSSSGSIEFIPDAAVHYGCKKKPTAVSGQSKEANPDKDAVEEIAAGVDAAAVEDVDAVALDAGSSDQSVPFPSSSSSSVPLDQSVELETLPSSLAGPDIPSEESSSDSISILSATNSDADSDFELMNQPVSDLMYLHLVPKSDSLQNSPDQDSGLKLKDSADPIFDNDGADADDDADNDNDDDADDGNTNINATETDKNPSAARVPYCQTLSAVETLPLPQPLHLSPSDVYTMIEDSQRNALKWPFGLFALLAICVGIFHGCYRLHGVSYAVPASDPNLLKQMETAYLLNEQNKVLTEHVQSLKEELKGVLSSKHELSAELHQMAGRVLDLNQQISGLRQELEVVPSSKPDSTSEPPPPLPSPSSEIYQKRDARPEDNDVPKTTEFPFVTLINDEHNEHNNVDSHVDPADTHVNSVDSNIDADVDSNIDSNVDSNIDSDVDSNIDADVDSDVDANIDSDVDASIDSDVDASIDSDVDFGINSDVDSSSDFDIDYSVDPSVYPNDDTNVDSSIDHTGDSIDDSDDESNQQEPETGDNHHHQQHDHHQHYQPHSVIVQKLNRESKKVEMWKRLYFHKTYHSTDSAESADSQGGFKDWERVQYFLKEFSKVALNFTSNGSTPFESMKQLMSTSLSEFNESVQHWKNVLSEKLHNFTDSYQKQNNTAGQKGRKSEQPFAKLDLYSKKMIAKLNAAKTKLQNKFEKSFMKMSKKFGTFFKSSKPEPSSNDQNTVKKTSRSHGLGTENGEKRKGDHKRRNNSDKQGNIHSKFHYKQGKSKGKDTKKDGKRKNKNGKVSYHRLNDEENFRFDNENGSPQLEKLTSRHNKHRNNQRGKKYHDSETLKEKWNKSKNKGETSREDDRRRSKRDSRQSRQQNKDDKKPKKHSLDSNHKRRGKCQKRFTNIKFQIDAVSLDNFSSMKQHKIERLAVSLFHYNKQCLNETAPLLQAWTTCQQMWWSFCWQGLFTVVNSPNFQCNSHFSPWQLAVSASPMSYAACEKCGCPYWPVSFNITPSHDSPAESTNNNNNRCNRHNSDDRHKQCATFPDSTTPLSGMWYFKDNTWHLSGGMENSVENGINWFLKMMRARQLRSGTTESSIEDDYNWFLKMMRARRLGSGDAVPSLEDDTNWYLRMMEARHRQQEQLFFD
ncbi:uncharacterized protein LOC115217867, partial [Argonauta hians]